MLQLNPYFNSMYVYKNSVWGYSVAKFNVIDLIENSVLGYSLPNIYNIHQIVVPELNVIAADKYLCIALEYLIEHKVIALCGIIVILVIILYMESVIEFLPQHELILDHKIEDKDRKYHHLAIINAFKARATKGYKFKVGIFDIRHPDGILISKYLTPMSSRIGTVELKGTAQKVPYLAMILSAFYVRSDTKMKLMIQSDYKKFSDKVLEFPKGDDGKVTFMSFPKGTVFEDNIALVPFDIRGKKDIKISEG